MALRIPSALLAVALLAGAQTAVAQGNLRLSFADALARAGGSAPSVELAGLRNQEAEARIREARSPLLPGLLGSAGWQNRTYNKNTLGINLNFPGFTLPDLIGPFNVYDARLTVTQSLFDYSSLQRVKAAREGLRSSQADSGAAAEGAVVSTAGAYLRALRAQASVQARQEDSTIADQLVNLAVAQQKAGVVPAIDVTRARTEFVVAEQGQVLARTQLDQAKIDLARSLGLGPEVAIDLADTLSAGLPVLALPVQRDSLVAFALASRPDLRAEQARGDAARRQGSAISAELAPRLVLAADAGGNGPTVDQMIYTRDVGIQVQWPILDGFGRGARKAESDAQVHQSDVRVRELRLQVAADVDAALLQLRSAEAQVQIAGERLLLAQDELNQAQERYKAGVAGNLDVINAQQSLVRARDVVIDARFVAAAARVALARSAGVARLLH